MRRAWVPGLSCSGFLAFAGSQDTSPGFRVCFSCWVSILRSVMAMRRERAGMGSASHGMAKGQTMRSMWRAGSSNAVCVPGRSGDGTAPRVTSLMSVGAMDFSSTRRKSEGSSPRLVMLWRSIMPGEMRKAPVCVGGRVTEKDAGGAWSMRSSPESLR